MSITIVGAGVIGLTAGLQLKLAHPELNITIWAAHLPGDISTDYTSPFAGADWHSFADQNDKLVQQIDMVGYRKFLELADIEPRAGVHTIKSEQYTDLLPWFINEVDDFKMYDDNNKGKLPPYCKFAYEFKGIVISVPIYLSYLLQRNLELGNTFKRIKIHHINDAYDNNKSTNLVINCTGLLALKLQGLNDSLSLYPVRGQTLLVRNNVKREYSIETFGPEYPDELLYIMPRKEGGTIIGGCFKRDCESTQEDPELTKRIIQRAIKCAPELIDSRFKRNSPSIDIVKVNIGFRPFRENGYRIELDSTRPWLIHCYGFGGAGYQSSYGAIEIVSRIVASKLASPKL